MSRHVAKIATAARLLAHHMDIPGVTPHEVAEAAHRAGVLHKLHDTAAEATRVPSHLLEDDPGGLDFLWGVPDVPVKKTPRNTSGYVPGSPKGGSSGTVRPAGTPAPVTDTPAQAHARAKYRATYTGADPSAPASPTAPATPPSHGFLPQALSDLLTPGPARAPARPEPKPSSPGLLSDVGKAVSTLSDEFAKGVKATTQATQDVAKLPNQRVDNVAGNKTLGNPTIAQLVAAGARGQIGRNQRGKLTVPETRKPARRLKAARQEVAQSGKLTGPLTPGQRVFAEQVAQETGLNPRVIAAQALAEESGGAAQSREAEGNHNWLNIGYFDSGPGAITQGSVWSSPQSAAKATSQFLKGQKFGASSGIQNILASAKAPPAQQVQAIADSGWATNPAYGESITGTLAQIGRTPTDPKAVAQLKAAKAQASHVGIPTKAGDVEPGPAPKTVFVRSDAKGFVDWAQALLGTQEGSKLQVKWAAEAGLSPAEAWCSEFIAAGIRRRGLTPPPGYPMSDAWTQWDQGTDLGPDLSKAKPGDILVIGGNQHVGLYVGGGKMIAGNWSDEVAEYNVSDDSRGVTNIIRPHFSGKKVAVQESTVLPGAALGPSGEIISGPAGTGGEVAGAAPATAQRRAPAPIALGSVLTPGAASAALPAAFQQFQQGAAPEAQEEGIGGLIDSILKRRRV